MSAAIMVTVLVSAGVYLILQKGLIRAAFGFVLIGHAANVLILAAGGMDRRQVPYVGEGAPDPDTVTDPLLQAFALTAIVITFALTVYMLAMAGHGGDDDAPASDAEPPAQEELHLAAGVPGSTHQISTVADPAIQRHPRSVRPGNTTSARPEQAHRAEQVKQPGQAHQPAQDGSEQDGAEQDGSAGNRAGQEGTT